MWFDLVLSIGFHCDLRFTCKAIKKFDPFMQLLQNFVHLFSTVLYVNRTELHFCGTIQCGQVQNYGLCLMMLKYGKEEGIFRR
jgi:hypothetical protein